MGEGVVFMCMELVGIRDNVRDKSKPDLNLDGNKALSPGLLPCMGISSADKPKHTRSE